MSHVYPIRRDVCAQVVFTGAGETHTDLHGTRVHVPRRINATDFGTRMIISQTFACSTTPLLSRNDTSLRTISAGKGAAPEGSFWGCTNDINMYPLSFLSPSLLAFAFPSSPSPSPFPPLNHLPVEVMFWGCGCQATGLRFAGTTGRKWSRSTRQHLWRSCIHCPRFYSPSFRISSSSPSPPLLLFHRTTIANASVRRRPRIILDERYLDSWPYS